MSELCERQDWTPVRVGPTLVGWIGPRAISQSTFGSYKPPYVLVIMEDAEYQMSVEDFEQHCIKELDCASRLENQVDDEFSALMNMLIYRKQFAVPVPVGSLDITDSGEIDYTLRSIATLTGVMPNFFNALAAEVQADLHKCSSPVEVVRKFADLISCNYLAALGAKLTWRGTLLNDILQQKKTTMRVKVVGRPFQDARYNDFSYVHELRSALPAYSIGSTGFGTFVDWQMRSAIDPTRTLPGVIDSTYTLPGNVFHVRASSLEEHVLAEQMFLTRGFLEIYLSAIGHGGEDASFFLSMAGDPMEEWLDGTTISMEEFLATTAQMDENMKQLGGFRLGTWLK